MKNTVDLPKGRILPYPIILRQLNKARGTNNYVRYVTHLGIYLQLSFFRDRTIEISTNSKNRALETRILRMRKVFNTQSNLAEFVFNFIREFNR